ncbi:MAG: NAD(P)/FAD-dependent oxidoreductase [Kiritimatiellae bacterium]|nr:NAD(P)/FAD-dependent oxidoreductase [Kiritimatiellia bacterium]
MGTIIIGAGPAGLTAAYELAKSEKTATIIEADTQVGGLSQTVSYRGYRFDIGGHRFFSNVACINRLWREILGDDLLVRSRLSRIHYNGRFFDYPLRATNALKGLGVREAARIGLSYAKAKASPSVSEHSLEQWVSNRFGTRLYEIFFKTYTEKVWGMPCSEISADWAAQRIRNLSLAEALRNIVSAKGTSRAGSVIPTLIEQFLYPRLGPGMMWERCRDVVAERGSTTLCDTRVTRIKHVDKRITHVVTEHGGETSELAADHVVSSMPLRELVLGLDPAAPEAVRQAAAALRYRDYFTAVLIVQREHVFPDNWIYIHTPTVLMGRIQNYKNWSPDMVPDPDTTSLGLEYFLSDSDPMWSQPDEELIAFALDECVQLGFVNREDVVDGTIVRMPKAYPVYDHSYTQNVAIIRDYLAGFENLQTIGRNGLHRYNNQDHSMLTGVYAARNIMGATHDVWSVNVDGGYHEQPLSTADDVWADTLSIDPWLARKLKLTFSRLDAVAAGVAAGIVSGLGLFVATAVLLLRGGEPVGPMLSLLGHYMPGYRLTWLGAFVGMAEVALLVFVLAYALARTRNVLVQGYLRHIRKRMEARLSQEVLDQ